MAQEAKQNLWMEPVLPPDKASKKCATSCQIQLQKAIVLSNVQPRSVQKVISFLRTELPINNADSLGHLKRVNAHKHSTKEIDILLCTESYFEKKCLSSNTDFWSGLQPLLTDDDSQTIDDLTKTVEVPLHSAPNKELHKEWSTEYWPISKPPDNQSLASKLRNHKDPNVKTASQAFDFTKCKISAVSSIEMMYPITNHTEQLERDNAMKCLNEAMERIQEKLNRYYKCRKLAKDQRMFLKGAVIFDPIQNEIVCSAYDCRDIWMFQENQENIIYKRFSTSMKSLFCVCLENQRIN